MVQVISIVCLMYADDNGLSTHSPAHASISLHPSVIRTFALTSDRRGEQTIGGEDEASLNKVLMGKKQPQLRKQHGNFRKSTDSLSVFLSLTI